MTRRHRCVRDTVLLTAAILSLTSLPPARGGEKNAEEPMVYELRTYTTNAGRLPALHARFRDHTVELFKKHGMTNVIYATPPGGENTLVYLIAHKSREAADASWKGFSNDPAWKKARAESVKDGKIVINVERRYLKPTEYSPVKSGGFASAVKKKGLLYELRTYTTNEGKLPELHARFRDHTMRIFKKHGMTNVLYTTPQDGENTLVYLIAHKDRKAADTSWAAFRNDPEWKKAYAASTANGKLVTKVERRFLTPTDYSPTE